MPYNTLIHTETIMSDRNLEKELQYYIYNDPEYGEDIENISYPVLIELLGELLQRIEKLEERLDKKEEYEQEQND